MPVLLLLPVSDPAPFSTTNQVKPLLSPPPPNNPPTPQKAFQIVQKAIFDELVQLVDGSAGKDKENEATAAGPGGERKGWEWKPKKGKVNVLMAVGIQVSWVCFRSSHEGVGLRERSAVRVDCL